MRIEEKWFGTRRIRKGDNSISGVRNVTGDRSGYLYNTGVSFLDQATIDAICAIASSDVGSARTFEDDSFPTINGQISKLNKFEFCDVVDDLIACHSLLGNEIPAEGINKFENYYSKLVGETDVVKRSIGQHIYDRQTMAIPNSEKDCDWKNGEYVAPLFDYERNIFGIKDFKLNAIDLMKRNRSLFMRVSKYLSESIKNFLDDNKLEDKKLGNKTLITYDR